MAHIINSHEWVLPLEVITKASLEATKEKLEFVYLSDRAQKQDSDFLFFKDEERKHIAFVIDKE